jgi:hypothetical protein
MCCTLLLQLLLLLYCCSAVATVCATVENNGISCNGQILDALCAAMQWRICEQKWQDCNLNSMYVSSNNLLLLKIAENLDLGKRAKPKTRIAH